MQAYKPNFPFNVPMYLLIPEYKTVKGVVKKVYPKINENLSLSFVGSFKTFGGTESTSNGLLTVLDTATVETWYRPDITADCRIVLAQNPKKVYEILGEPENINMYNQFLKFKVQAVSGGA